MVARLIKEMQDRFDCRVIRYDRAKMKELEFALDEVGVDIPIEECGTGYFTMDKILNNFENLLASGKLTHSNTPLANFCLYNAVTKVAPQSPHGERRIVKAHKHSKIDTIFAMLLACGTGIDGNRSVKDVDDLIFGTWKSKRERNKELKEMENRKQSDIAAENARLMAQREAEERAEIIRKAREDAENNVAQ